MNNRDNIQATYSLVKEVDNILENTINIQINGEQVYHLDDEIFTDILFIETVSTIYKKYIKGKRWNIK